MFNYQPFQQLILWLQVLSEELLATAIQGFARLQFNHNLFLDCAVQECITRQPINFKPAQITGIVHSLAVLRNEDVMSEILMDITSLSAAKRVDEFTAGELADLLWSYTKLFKYHRDVKMLDGLTRSLVSKVDTWKGTKELIVSSASASSWTTREEITSFWLYCIALDNCLRSYCQ